MPIRPALLPLIKKVRALLGEQDSDASCSFWDDSSIADALEARATNYIEHRLVEGGRGTGEIFYNSNLANWDDNAHLTDGMGAMVTPLNASPLTGRWVVSDAVRGPLYLSGTTYCIWGAAADMLLSKAAARSARFDVEAGDQKLKRSQESTALRQLAQDYLRKARPRTVKAGRSDVR